MTEIVGSEDDFGDISSRSWFRAIESIAKNGYKEGASEGRDTAFQESFDLGYEEGFKYGMHLGLQKALQRLHSHNQDDLARTADPELLNCQMCLNRDLLQQHVTNVDNTQKESNTRRVAELSKEMENVLEIGVDSDEVSDK